MKMRKFLRTYPVHMERTRSGLFEWKCVLSRQGRKVTAFVSGVFPPTTGDVLRELKNGADVVEILDAEFEAFLARQLATETEERARRRWEPMHAKWRTLDSLLEHRARRVFFRHVR